MATTSSTSIRFSSASSGAADPAKRAFPPVVDARVRALVLGSLPGEASLAAAQYYAHPRNSFWALIGAVLDQDLAALPYEDRLPRLLAGGIGLWDVIETAQRRGSLDAAITDATARDLPALVAHLPQLRVVAFNGAKAAALGARQLAGGTLTLLTLPSSSPAHAAMTFDDKKRAWMGLRPFLGEAP